MLAFKQIFKEKLLFRLFVCLGFFQRLIPGVFFHGNRNSTEKVFFFQCFQTQVETTLFGTCSEERFHFLFLRKCLLTVKHFFPGGSWKHVNSMVFQTLKNSLLLQHTVFKKTYWRCSFWLLSKPYFSRMEFWWAKNVINFRRKKKDTCNCVLLSFHLDLICVSLLLRKKNMCY